MRTNWYQLFLIIFCFFAVVLLGAFLYTELFPSYRLYQNSYVAVEEFRAEYTGQPVPPFKKEIKQLIIKPQDNGPETIDRCTTCHVAMNLEHFSSTVLARDLNDNVVYDSSGKPLLERNPDYVWAKLDQKIASLERQGKKGEADKMRAVRYRTIEDMPVDMAKVLVMHPLIGDEVRPLEHHPMGKFGCTSCHSGNGRSVVAARAHGPVYDAMYQAAHEGPRPAFTESDPNNDPAFSRVYNHKPTIDLLFQTTPLLPGALMEAKCVQCHQPAKEEIAGVVARSDIILNKKERQLDAIRKGVTAEEESLMASVALKKKLLSVGYETTVVALEKRLEDPTATDVELDRTVGQLAFVKRAYGEGRGIEGVVARLTENMERILGNSRLVNLLEQKNATKDLNILKSFLDEHEPTQALAGTIFAKIAALSEGSHAMQMVRNAAEPMEQVYHMNSLVKEVSAGADLMLHSYNRGRELFFNQACYSCHRIDGLSRGSVGPDLSAEGFSYPWFIKESIVWPQADLKTSVMPNFHLDHSEVEDLMTFLMAQRNEQKVLADVEKERLLKAWEGGKKLSYEKPIAPTKIKDVVFAMKTFATEGCASCHQLEGFSSQVGFANEGNAHERAREKKWFADLFPRGVPGSQIVRMLQERKEEVEGHINRNAHSKGAIEEIEEEHPGVIESFYDNFQYAMRAQNDVYRRKEEEATTAEAKRVAADELAAWKRLVGDVRALYITEYGLGRRIAPVLNWTGVYRSKEWMIGHFKNPSLFTAKSFMPVFNFDESKFLSLDNMIDHLGKANAKGLREEWNREGFNPEAVYQALCSSCHGEHRLGNGPVAEMLYPIPKNLRNPTWLRNLTKERVIHSITHGVNGTPMPPWGEAAKIGEKSILSKEEIRIMTDWLFEPLAGAEIIKTEEDAPKWSYTPQDVVDEINKSPSVLYGTAVEHRDVGSYFVQKPAFYQGESPRYEIKQEYYTEGNLLEGERLFVINCAHCHGKQADGSGLRAAVMADAKPRMLTNFKWLQDKDDMHLLRTIKFGVPGTSMIPLGDEVDPVQRMQIVMFIRELTKEKQQQETLQNVLYTVFGRAEQTVEAARTNEYKAYASTQKNYDEAAVVRKELYLQIENRSASPEQAAAAYAKELSLLQQLQQKKEGDEKFLALIQLIKQERALLDATGQQVIGAQWDADLFSHYIAIVEAASSPIDYTNGKLLYSAVEGGEDHLQNRVTTMEGAIDTHIVELEQFAQTLQALLPSVEKEEKLAKVRVDLNVFADLKATLAKDLEQIKTMRAQQKEIIDQL
ncbi:c-type cytochrome [Simkania negevensis]|uniref:C-type cytochrome n=1 Tax=Simkania negevensis TaxID=83561 RepID=A0ABS3AR83_9BACT|nr:c-type cytochrome [Simkania negevensis]